MQGKGRGDTRALTGGGGCSRVMAGGDETERRIFNCKDRIPQIRLVLMYNTRPPIKF